MKIDFTVCVYCGSSCGSNPLHKEAVRAIGAEIAKNNIGIVYGGGGVGMMGILADSAIQNNGKVVGIMPEYLITQEAKHEGLSELKIVENIHIRKKLMEDAADAFLILPGGIGTLDELFEVLVLKSLEQLEKPVIIFNSEGYFDGVISMIRKMQEDGFVSVKSGQHFRVADTVGEVMEMLKEWKIENGK
ncbi:MAG: TIGR00730 family Rossman fold protein [Alphaproteobacteria bacterium]|nr:TIGR00730 family Rossman fold protein [Alphaproteobacteria bacterium]MCL2506010.1 TIGR00730 family Rossman fold protein [Alphaproteobacteria bacterium]